MKRMLSTTKIMLLLMLFFISCRQSPKTIWWRMWIPPNGKFNYNPVVAGEYLLVGSSHVSYSRLHDPIRLSYGSIDNSGYPPRRDPSSYTIYTVPSSSLDYCFYAFDIETGETEWEFSATGGGSTSACIYNDMMYFGDRAGYLYALEINTGNVKYRVKVGDMVTSNPILYDDLIFFGTSDADQHFLCAIKEDNGEVLWKSLSPKEILRTPVAANGVLCFADIGGHIHAIDLRNGEELWKFIPESNVKPIISSNLLVGDNVLYFGGSVNKLYALDIANGTLKWKYATDDMIRKDLVVQNGTIYFTDANHIYALDMHTLRLLWKTMIPSGITSAASVINGVAYVGSTDGLWAIDTDGGMAVWKTGPPVAGGRLVVTKAAVFMQTNYCIHAIGLQ